MEINFVSVNVWFPKVAVNLTGFAGVVSFPCRCLQDNFGLVELLLLTLWS